MRREVEERIVLRERIPQSAELHLAPETKRILAFANEESQQFEKSSHRTRTSAFGTFARGTFNCGGNSFSIRFAPARRARGNRNRQNGFPNLYSMSGKEKPEVPHLQEFTRDLTTEAAQRKTRSADRTRNGNRKNYRNSLPPDEK